MEKTKIVKELRRVKMMQLKTTDGQGGPSPQKDKLGLGRQHRQEKNEGGSASRKELWSGLQRAKSAEQMGPGKGRDGTRTHETRTQNGTFKDRR